MYHIFMAHPCLITHFFHIFTYVPIMFIKNKLHHVILQPKNYKKTCKFYLLAGGKNRPLLHFLFCARIGINISSTIDRRERANLSSRHLFSRWNSSREASKIHEENNIRAFSRAYHKFRHEYRPHAAA